MLKLKRLLLSVLLILLIVLLLILLHFLLSSLLLTWAGKLILLENLVLGGPDGLWLAIVILFLKSCRITIVCFLLVICFEPYFGDISALTIC